MEKEVKKTKEPKAPKKRKEVVKVGRTIRFEPSTIASAKKLELDIPDICRKAVEAAIAKAK